MKGWNYMLRKLSLLAMFSILILSNLNIFFNDEICSAKDGITLYVGGTEAGNYTTIQEAIHNSSDNDTIFVYNGTYNENIVINKSIDLIGSGKNFTFIDGNNSVYIILIKSSWVNITGFTIQNARAGIYIFEANYSFNNITDNFFSNNWEGIRLYESSNNKLSDNIFYNNSNFGIVSYESKNNLIVANTFIDNYRAISLGRWSDGNIIHGNNLTDNIFAINLEDSFNNLIYENLIINSSCGILLDNSNNNNITNNNIEFSRDSGIYLSYSDDNDILENNFFKNNKDIDRESEPPSIKAPGFEVLLVTCAILFVLFLRRRR